MTFQPYEIAIIAAFLFFIMLSLAWFSYCAGFREGRVAGVRQMDDYHRRLQREHERMKRAMTHPRSEWDL